MQHGGFEIQITLWFGLKERHDQLRTGERCRKFDQVFLGWSNERGQRGDRLERKGQRQNQLRSEGDKTWDVQAREVGGLGVDKQDQLSHRGVRGIDTRGRGEVPE